ncbi:HAMP domain-containing protein [Streptomyces sp. SID4919]|uniref:sensor histidine kinase n=1 Tax=unclassified Streptomyces TaxID=2593676 RepID=UPI000823F675|nr:MULTISPECIES: HAMP domain-containing sensor histidine kinase [unclassified Streptomyces]MYY09654.1 HAMP domain-containing protein [Streptomyces sp. SID4919]SCK35281.1 Signal transduction histidine kinase [Streptomyces sp. AmelKG-E11A]
MTGPRPLPGRSLRTRLALFYAAGVFLAGIVVLAVVTLPLVGIQSTVPAHRPGPGTITGTGHGIGPHQLVTGSAVALAVLVPVALVTGWFVAGRFLAPLRAITATARAISAGNLHQRLDLGEPADELTELGGILDDLFARLQASFDAHRHFVANASHELRTPLAGLRTLLEVALADPDADAGTLRSACEDALALGGHQERLVQALLALATSERGVTRRDCLDLAHIARRVLTSRLDRATEKGIDLAEDLTPAVTTGDPRLVESLIANLVENAIRHNHPDGHVRITTRTSGTGAALTITNSGPVVPGDQLERLFQPFQRLVPDRDSRHDGYGLGLAIVNAVTRAHHATLTTSAPPEGGLAITVRFAHPPHPHQREEHAELTP